MNSRLQHRVHADSLQSARFLSTEYRKYFTWDNGTGAWSSPAPYSADSQHLLSYDLHSTLQLHDALLKQTHVKKKYCLLERLYDTNNIVQHFSQVQTKL